MAASAATRCLIGWPTSRSGWRRSARPRLSWKPKPRPPPRRRGGAAHKAEEKRIAEGRKKNGKTPAPPREEPDGKTQRNFTDPESRVLLTKDGYIQGYNAQAAVDATAQIIVAHGLTRGHERPGSTRAAGGPDRRHISAASQRKPQPMPAICSEANLQALADREIGAYIATGRAKHPDKAKRAIAGPLTKAMRDKLRRAGWRSRYRLRKQIVEPVFGQIKQARGFRQFLLARHRESDGRMGPDLHRPQSHQARPGRMIRHRSQYAPSCS